MGKIVIIGGGIVGLFSAFFLEKEGHDITIIEKNNYNDGTSFGNAGLIVPSHIIPLAEPGIYKRIFQWILKPDGPLSFKFPPSREFISWSFKFLKNCNSHNVNYSIPILRDITLLSRSIYQELHESKEIEFDLESGGLLMLYKTLKVQAEENHMASKARDSGIEARELKANDVFDLEPEIRAKVLGGVYYPGDAHLDPAKLMQALMSYLKKKRVTFYSNTTAKDFTFSTGNLTGVVTNHITIPCDELLIASGVGSSILAEKLKLKLPLQAGKGYTFKVSHPGNKKLKMAAILVEPRISVTPYSNGIRFGGGMGIGKSNGKIEIQRIKGMVKAIPEFYPDLEGTTVENENVWVGYRPCSHDGLPFIGRVPGFKNVTIATGHAMLGITLAPVTGKLVSEIISEHPPSINIEAFKVDRG